MPKQRLLDLNGEGLVALWEQLPVRCRTEAIAILARLIARAAHVSSKRKGIDT